MVDNLLKILHGGIKCSVESGTGAVISFSEPAILVGASVVADLGTAWAQLSLYNIDTGTIVANFWFNYSAGSTTNVAAYMSGPTV